MPTINLNRKEIEKKIGKIQLDKLKDRISMLGTDLDEVTDKEIIVEIFPNRPDMLSQEGFLRGLRSFIGKNKGLTTSGLNMPAAITSIHFFLTGS